MTEHFGAGKAEYLKAYRSFFVGAAGSDLVQDLQDRHSTTSNLITINNVATHWKIAKQPEPTNATPNAELTSLHSKLQEIKKVRNFSASIGYPIQDSTILHEDNQGTIKSINTDKIIPTHRNHDVIIHSALHHKRLGTIQVQECKSDLMLADPNTKPIGGPTLQQNIDRVIGIQYYPSKKSEHYKLLFNTPEVSIADISSSKKAKYPE
eukprot:15367174-Ditylum_brightwellii.AAC.1